MYVGRDTNMGRQGCVFVCVCMRGGVIVCNVCVIVCVIVCMFMVVYDFVFVCVCD